MEKINDVINWLKVDNLLMEHYTVQSSMEGADTYTSLMLLRAFLLQKWFKIKSDTELENQINDRISFKKLLLLYFNKHSPDHSTFSWFWCRLSKNAMMQINSVVLLRFTDGGLIIPRRRCHRRTLGSICQPSHIGKRGDQEGLC